MDERFSKELWELGLKNPELQTAIAESITGDSKNYKGYSIPTGDITLAVFDEKHEENRDKLLQIIKTASEMKVKDLARIFSELRISLTVAEVQGEELKPHEETLKDIDVTALASFALIKYLGIKQNEKERPLNT